VENLDIVFEFIKFARILGSFLCFQGEEATFKFGSEYFPVCSGCFGIYLGALIALTFLPFFGRFSKKLFSVRYGLPLLLPLVVYWAILNIEAYTGAWIVPGVKELYFFAGILFGGTVSNGAYNLGLETSFADKTSKIGKNFWVSTSILIFLSLLVFSLRSIETAVLFIASLIFVFGFFGLVGFIVLWMAACLAPYFKHKKSASGEAFASLLTLIAIVVSFLFFQALIFENKVETVFLALFFGIISFGFFAYTLRNFTFEKLGFVKKDWGKQIVYGIFLGVFLYLAFRVYRFLISSFQEPIFSVNLSNYVEIPIVFVIVVSEEFFFRGYAINMLERHMNAVASCLFSSIIFVLYHQVAIFKFLLGIPKVDLYLDYEHIMLLFLGGLLLSHLFVKKRSLIMPVTVHFTWNLLIFLGAA
jgi:membrane protease YdiL (CAAX protease family)/uncharacterized membrane protein